MALRRTLSCLVTRGSSNDIRPARMLSQPLLRPLCLPLLSRGAAPHAATPPLLPHSLQGHRPLSARVFEEPLEGPWESSEEALLHNGASQGRPSLPSLISNRVETSLPSLGRLGVLESQAMQVRTYSREASSSSSSSPSHSPSFPSSSSSSSSPPRAPSAPSLPVVGFVGLGNMGAPMASNLLRAGYPLLAFDTKPTAVNSLADQGATAAHSIQELRHRADVIVTMLPSPRHVREVYQGPGGLLAPTGEPLRTVLFIDSSTVDPATARAVAAAAKQCKLAEGATRLSWPELSREGASGWHRDSLSTTGWHHDRLFWSDHPRVLDAPVSGGVPGARAASLSFMVGGPLEAFAAAEPILGCMGRRAMHCGAAGAGAAAKLCNNLALAIQMAGVSEALALGQRLGLDPALLTQVFNSSSARCWSSDTYNPAPGVMPAVPASNGYQGGFACALMLKDLTLALAAAASQQAHGGIDNPMRPKGLTQSPAASQQAQGHSSMGHGDIDTPEDSTLNPAASEQSHGGIPMGLQVKGMYESAVAAGLENKDFSVLFKHIYGGRPSEG